MKAIHFEAQKEESLNKTKGFLDYFGLSLGYQGHLKRFSIGEDQYFLGQLYSLSTRENGLIPQRVYASRLCLEVLQ